MRLHRRSTQIALLAAFGLAAVLASNAILDTFADSAGERFKRAVLAEFRAAHHTIPNADLTAWCKQRLEGMPLDTLRRLLLEAGGREMVDVKTLPKSVQAANDADYFGGFLISSSLVGSSDFGLSIRVSGTPPVVQRVTHCNVHSVFL